MVGEETSFVATQLEETKEEVEHSYNKTEEQKNKDAHNRSNYREVRSLKKEWVKSIEEKTVTEYYYDENSITVAITEPLLIDKLRPILKAEYYPDSRDYEVDEYNYDESPIEITAEQKDAMLGVFEDKDFNVPNPNSVNKLNWNPIYEDGYEFTSYDWEVIQIILGGGQPIKKIGNTARIYDCTTYTERYDIIEKYINKFSDETEIETTYILEIRAESVVENGLYSSVPQTWHNTGNTHFWQVEYIAGENATYHSPVNVFGGNTHSQTFYLPGEYRVTASQVLQNTYSNALTYTINEYWVIAETGMVIWSYESEGVTLDPEELKPLSELGIDQIVYYDDLKTQQEYVTVFDETIEVTPDGISQWDGPFGNPGVWGYDFSTSRIN